MKTDALQIQMDLFSQAETPAHKMKQGPPRPPRPVATTCKKIVFDWRACNKNPKRFPYYSKNAAYLIEHRSSTFEHWIALDELKLL
jgi:hypothetical protein